MHSEKNEGMKKSFVWPLFETKKQPPVSHNLFVKRMMNHLAAALCMILFSLILGIAGYMVFENLSVTDAFLNAAMLLGGMGPVNMPLTEAGKLFAGIYALYAGLVFIATAALMLTPLIHRVIHRFHWDN
jgi:hypothetical protein